MVQAVSETKPSWMSFLAWPLIGAGISYSVLGAMTIGLFVFPFVLTGLFAMFKWGGNRKSSVGLISGAGLPFLFLAYLNRSGPGMVCGPYKNGGQECTQEYSPWPFLIIGAIFVLLGVLMFIRIRSGSAISSRSRGLLVLILVVSVLTFGLIAAPSTRPSMTTESGRVQYSYNEISKSLAKKEGVPTSILPPVRVAVASYQDGSKASLWVPNPAKLKPRSNCFAVDVVRGKSGSAGFFESLCLAPKSAVILERQNSVVVGFIGLTKASQVSVTVLDQTYVVPMIFGYFLVPSSLSDDPTAKFTITYTEPGQGTCKVRNLVAPGISTSFECVIS